MSVYKIGILLLNLVPLVVLSLMADETAEPETALESAHKGDSAINRGGRHRLTYRRCSDTGRCP